MARMRWGLLFKPSVRTLSSILGVLIAINCFILYSNQRFVSRRDLQRLVSGNGIVSENQEEMYKELLRRSLSDETQDRKDGDTLSPSDKKSEKILNTRRKKGSRRSKVVAKTGVLKNEPKVDAKYATVNNSTKDKPKNGSSLDSNKGKTKVKRKWQKTKQSSNKTDRKTDSSKPRQKETEKSLSLDPSEKMKVENSTNKEQVSNEDRVEEKGIGDHRPSENGSSSKGIATKDYVPFGNTGNGTASTNSCVEHHDNLQGRIRLNKRKQSAESVLSVSPFIEDGGSFNPDDCVPKENTAIIFPFRKRTNHLHTLLYNLLPILHRQRIKFTIFVIEQDDYGPFNRGMLFNVGFLEATKLENFTCFIMHDVDLIPINDQNFYHCNDRPTHFVSGVNKFGYKLRYDGMFGGVAGFTRDQYERINGFSNLYFGWGGEDDDLHSRVVQSGMKRVRKYQTIGLYDMIIHPRDKGNEKNKSRKTLLRAGAKRQNQEGLKTTIYKTLSVKMLPIYTWVQVHIDMKEVLKTAPSSLKNTVKSMSLAAHLS